MKNVWNKIKEFFRKLFKKDKPTTIKYVSFGNPDCSKAVEDPNVQIKNLKWSRKQLSYEWASEAKLERWGITHPHDAAALACFGYLDKEGTWRFCKIDWISSDRLTRDMHNVETGYNGINANEYFSASKHGFFIMDQKGKIRTNIIVV